MDQTQGKRLMHVRIMRTMPFAFIAASLLATLAVEAQPGSDHSGREIVHHEFLFANTAVVKGRNASFLEFFAEGALFFNPLPADARAYYGSVPEPKSYLLWRPAAVEASSDGTFGYSTGPWEIRPVSMGHAAVVRGWFFSVWERHGGVWKVTFDTGITMPLSVREPDTVAVIPTPSAVPSTVKMEEAEEEFRKVEKERSRREAFERFAAGDARVYRNGERPFTGRAAALRRTSSEKERYSYSTARMTVAPSGGLGYVVGTAVSAAGDTAAFLRVWRNDGSWRVVTDLLSPVK